MNLEQIMESQRCRMNIYGGSNEDSLENTIFDDFESNPSYRKLVFKGKTIGVHFISGSASLKDASISRIIIPKPPTELDIGSMVIDKFNTTWLCLLKDDLQYNKVTVMPCNHTLKWQDENNDIHIIPCILADKTSVYSDGLSKTEFISLGTDQVSIVVQANEETLKIPINKRFIFHSDKNNIYEVNRRDTLTGYGLISFVVKKSLYSPIYDNLELNLANYNGKRPTDTEPDNPDIEDDNNKSIITGKSEISLWDEDVEYSINTDKEVEWSLSRLDLVKITKIEGNKCYIDSGNNNKNIGIFELIATIDGEVYKKEIELVYM